MGAIGEKISKETIREKVISTIDMTREPQEKELHEIIDRIMEEELKEKYLTIKERIKIHKEVFNSIKGLGILEDLLEMDEVKLEFEENALRAIAKKALEKDTGARALRAIIEEFMLDIMYEIRKL